MIVLPPYVLMNYDLRIYKLNQYLLILFMYHEVVDQLNYIEVLFKMLIQ